MRKLMAVVLSVASLAIFAVTAEASVTRSKNAISEFSPNAPQVRIQIGRHRRHDRDYDNRWSNRTVRQTRIVRYGWHTYRETYLVRYLPDGRTQTVLVDRERIS